MEDTKNLYLDMIQFGLDGIVEGISIGELLTFLETEGYGYSGSEFIFKTIFENLFYRKLHDDIPESEDTRYLLKENAFFDFIQYKSYNHSIQQAKRANQYSTLAIIISIIGLIITIILK